MNPTPFWYQMVQHGQTLIYLQKPRPNSLILDFSSLKLPLLITSKPPIKSVREHQILNLVNWISGLWSSNPHRTRSTLVWPGAVWKCKQRGRVWAGIKRAGWFLVIPRDPRFLVSRRQLALLGVLAWAPPPPLHPVSADWRQPITGRGRADPPNSAVPGGQSSRFGLLSIPKGSKGGY